MITTKVYSVRTNTTILTFFKNKIKEAIAMNELILKKQENNVPKFDELFQMISDLKDFLDEEADFKDANWKKNLDIIIDFQDDDGSFKFFDSRKIPSDAVVDFIYTPTYLCTAILMKAYMTDSESFTLKAQSALKSGLKMSTSKNLRGHGFEAFKGQIEALNIFMKAGVKEFIDLYPGLCPEFTQMIDKIVSNYKDKILASDYKGSWGESYEDDIKSVAEYFCQRQVLVYGTLMKGESNHGYLENSTYLGTTLLPGYDMYDVGWYPAIVSGEGFAIGEVYKVPLEDMPSIDRLEGEGSLYAKRCERITLNGEATFAYVYVFLHEVSDLKKIPSWKEYVWYVSYGSNMLYERFMCYIEGGSFEGSRLLPEFDDTTPPVEVRAIDIPYGMYFAENSGSWQGQGVSFLDTTKRGQALGVAYLITKEQFDHVVYWENAGRRQNKAKGWYEDTITIGEMDGFEVKTITNTDLREYNNPCREYINTLRRGIRENWPEMSDNEIEDYLNSCMR